jgi:hypothetical protein
VPLPDARNGIERFSGYKAALVAAKDPDFSVSYILRDIANVSHRLCAEVALSVGCLTRWIDWLRHRGHAWSNHNAMMPRGWVRAKNLGLKGGLAQQVNKLAPPHAGSSSPISGILSVQTIIR